MAISASRTLQRGGTTGDQVLLAGIGDMGLGVGVGVLPGDIINAFPPSGDRMKIIKTRLGFPGWTAAPVIQKFCLDQMWCWGLPWRVATSRAVFIPGSGSGKLGGVGVGAQEEGGLPLHRASPPHSALAPRLC